MAHLCNKCHRVHSGDCPKRPTLEEMRLATEKFLKLLDDVRKRPVSNKTLYGGDLPRAGKSFDEKRDEHLRALNDLVRTKDDPIPCIHDTCELCFGTGLKRDGTPCIHYIACPCPRCTIHMW
jgi:hypothetical protein